MTMLTEWIPKPRRFTADEYYKMAEAGVLHEGDRIELIEGEILEMSPIGTPHYWCVVRLTQMLSQKVGTRAFVAVQAPVHLDDHSEPEPDITLIARMDDSQKPSAAETLLLIEVSDSTLHYDRTTKLKLYAKHRVKEFWIVNLPERQIEVYREPSLKGYARTTIVYPPQTVSPLAFPTIKLPVKKILGEPPPPKRSASPQPKKR